MTANTLCRVFLLFAAAQLGATIDFNRSPRQAPGSIFTVGNGEQCLGNDRSTGGVCLSRNQCNTQGGKAIGFCGVFATCCSLNACDVRTNTKVAVFINPPLTQESSGLECSYNVEINNNNVCQMRIDFETFNLAPPTTVEPVENVTQRPGYTCRNDIFQVINLQGNSDYLPALCGDNNGQHLYVRVNASTNSRSIRINFKIADRNTQPHLPQATWKIKVTQLECFNTLGKFNDGILHAITSSLPATPFISTADRDEYLIAPPGCLQYYPDRAGTIDSFNYNRGSGPYIANLAYSICFKRTPDVCGIKFTAASFQMAYRAYDNLYVDTDCQVNPVTQGISQSEDYLLIPEAETADGVRGSKFCGTSVTNQIIASTPPGPLTLFFRSDNLVVDDVPESGFRFTAASFQMAYRAYDNLYVDTDCQVNPVTQGISQSEDYLLIPEAETADGVRGSKFCGTSVTNQIIASTPPGPLTLFFRSDNLVVDDVPESGFRFSYNVLNNCYSK